MRVCTNASTHVREQIWMHLLPGMYLRGPRHKRICERALLLQSDDGKKRTGAYPIESLSLTDGGPQNQPGGSFSSRCSRGRESAKKLGSREGAP